MARIVLALLCAALPFDATTAQDAAAPASASAAAGPAGATAIAAAPGKLRDGRYAGLGIGYSGQSDGQAAAGLVTRLRAGATVSPRLMLGVEAGFADHEDFEQLTTFDVAATFFPVRRLLFLRAGFGYTGERSVGPYAAEAERRGVNALAGLGFQLGRSNGVNVTLNADGQFHLVPYGGIDRSKGAFVGLVSDALWAGLEWH